jgi:hypothetical protein
LLNSTQTVTTFPLRRDLNFEGSQVCSSSHLRIAAISAAKSAVGTRIMITRMSRPYAPLHHRDHGVLDDRRFERRQFSAFALRRTLAD